MKGGYDYRLRAFTGRFDWRAKWRFGFAHFGTDRYLRIGKLGIRLWPVRSGSQVSTQRVADALSEATHKRSGGVR